MPVSAYQDSTNAACVDALVEALNRVRIRVRVRVRVRHNAPALTLP